MSDIFDLAKRLSGEKEVEQATSFVGQIVVGIIVIFFIITAVWTLFFLYKYLFESEKVITTNVDPPEEGKMTAEEYNKKTDASATQRNALN